MLPRREVIGAPDCPLIHRWTIRPWGGHGHSDLNWKLMVHHFLPNADDRDVHDHPRPFWTLVLRGSYDDMRPCDACAGEGFQRIAHGRYSDRITPCLTCMSASVVLNERMKAGALRRRPAVHRHRTRVGPNGCWTVVLMGPLQRPWGFWRRGAWWHYRDYENEFGFAMRCDDD